MMSLSGGSPISICIAATGEERNAPRIVRSVVHVVKVDLTKVILTLWLLSSIVCLGLGTLRIKPQSRFTVYISRLGYLDDIDLVT